MMEQFQDDDRRQAHEMTAPMATAHPTVQEAMPALPVTAAVPDPRVDSWWDVNGTAPDAAAMVFRGPAPPATPAAAATTAATEPRPWVSASFAQVLAALDAAPALPVDGGLNRVAVVMPLCESALLGVVNLALVQRGLAVCPLDPKLAPAAWHVPSDLEGLATAAQQLQATTCVAHPSLAGACRAVFGAVVTASWAVDTGSPTTVAGIDWVGADGAALLPPTAAAAAPPEEHGGQPGAGSLVLRTSGTTGTPKLVPNTIAQLLTNAHLIAASLQLRAGADVCLTAMPMFHIGGFSCTFLAPLLSGTTAVHCGPFHAHEFLELVERPPPVVAAVTWFYAAPTLHKALLLAARAANRVRIEAPGLRLIRSGAAPLPHEDALALEELFAGRGGGTARVMPTYSMSECMPVAAVPLGTDIRSCPGTVGLPIGPTVRICDPVGNPLPYGTVGEVRIRGPGVTHGYLPAAPGQELPTTDAAGFLATGDLGELSAGTGWLRLCGRSREMAKVGGEQVSLFEVEDAIRSHCPEVAFDLLLAFGVPNDFWGEEVAVAVVCSQWRDAGEALALIKARLAALPAFMVPKQVLLLADDRAIPRTACGKYQRLQCAQALGARAVAIRPAVR